MRPADRKWNFHGLHCLANHDVVTAVAMHSTGLPNHQHLTIYNYFGFISIPLNYHLNVDGPSELTVILWMLSCRI